VVVHGEALEFTGYMVHSARVKIPIWIIAGGGRHHSNNTGIKDVIFIKSILAYICGVSKFHTDLALGMVLATGLIRWRRAPEVVGEATAGAR
jgi:hypothetical protein